MQPSLSPSDPLRQPWAAVEVDPGPLWGVHSQGIGDRYAGAQGGSVTCVCATGAIPACAGEVLPGAVACPLHRAGAG